MTYKVLAVLLLSISIVTHAACACSQASAHSEVSLADDAHDCCPGGKAPVSSHDEESGCRCTQPLLGTAEVPPSVAVPNPVPTLTAATTPSTLRLVVPSRATIGSLAPPSVYHLKCALRI
jgi:hypothetical protein